MSSTRVSGPISQPAQVPDDSQLEESPYEDTYTFDALKALDWNLSITGKVESVEPYGQAHVLGVQAGSQIIGLGPAGLDPPPISASRVKVNARLKELIDESIFRVSFRLRMAPIASEPTESSSRDSKAWNVPPCLVLVHDIVGGKAKEALNGQMLMAERVDAKSGHWVIYVNGQVRKIPPANCRPVMQPEAVQAVRLPQAHVEDALSGGHEYTYVATSEDTIATSR